MAARDSARQRGTTTSRRRRARQAEPEAAEEDEEEEEAEEQPKRRGRPRAESKLSDREVYDMRKGGAKWSEIAEAMGVPATAAIRVPFYRVQLEEGEIEPLDDDPQAIVEARDEDGEGWDLLAVRTGLGVAAVKALYQEGEGELADSGGRPYGKGEGVRHVTAEELNAAKARAKADGDETEEGEEEEAEEEEAEEAPRPQRRRRRART